MNVSLIFPKSVKNWVQCNSLVHSNTQSMFVKTSSWSSKNAMAPRGQWGWNFWERISFCLVMHKETLSSNLHICRNLCWTQHWGLMVTTLDAMWWRNVVKCHTLCAMWWHFTTLQDTSPYWAVMWWRCCLISPHCCVMWWRTQCGDITTSNHSKFNAMWSCITTSLHDMVKFHHITVHCGDALWWNMTSTHCCKQQKQAWKQYKQHTTIKQWFDAVLHF